ncbi:hypothetical protein KPH14_005914 [Odynerus spinipes]|uniref:Uncharacterized protein n=1 Tax=Odynerus spinipes TaxID=1348599 RepID=A0AAD9VP22_9HYME|nr:hypothetical protein KPH14_005914 [Odynerus spinipes]
MQEGPLGGRGGVHVLLPKLSELLPRPTSIFSWIPKATLNGVVVVTSTGRAGPDARGSIARLVFGGRRISQFVIRLHPDYPELFPFGSSPGLCYSFALPTNFAVPYLLIRFSTMARVLWDDTRNTTSKSLL